MNLDSSLGAIEVGVMVAVLLCGMNAAAVYIWLCVAAFSIYRSLHNRSSGYSSATARITPYMRCLVLALWYVVYNVCVKTCIWPIHSVLTSLSTVFSAFYLYNVTCTSFGDVTVLTSSSWSLNTVALCNGLAVVLVQVGSKRIRRAVATGLTQLKGFFAHRIRILSKKWYITIISWLGSLLALITAIIIMIVGFVSPTPLFASSYKWVPQSTLSLFLFVDIVNTVALCAYYRVERTGSEKYELSHFDSVLTESNNISSVIISIDNVLNRLFVLTMGRSISTSFYELMLTCWMKKRVFWRCRSSYIYSCLFGGINI